ncbi:MAG: hypothetical protein QNJ90_03715 [Planctomycetota bacterium]|nr:hypothetical protein [Planctomycetota bacterium]
MRSLLVCFALALLCVAPGCKPGWSADGKQVAYWWTPDEGATSYLATYHIETGASRRVFVSKRHSVLRPMFAADGKSLLVLAAREPSGGSTPRSNDHLCDVDLLRIRLDRKSGASTRVHETIATLQRTDGDALLWTDMLLDAQGQLWWTAYQKPRKKAGVPERIMPVRIDLTTGAITRPFPKRDVRLESGRAGIFGVEGLVLNRRVGRLRLSEKGPVFEHLSGPLGRLRDGELIAIGTKHLAAMRPVRSKEDKRARCELLITDLAGTLRARVPVPQEVAATLGAATFDAEDRTLWAFSAGGRYLLRFDVQKGRFVRAVAVPDAPDQFAPSPGGTHFAGGTMEPAGDGTLLCVFDLTGAKPQIRRIKIPK